MDRNQFFDIVFSDEKTAKELIEKTPEEVSAYVNAHGGSCTPEDVKAIGEEFKAIAAKQNNGELDESSLENVAGGLKDWQWGLIVGFGVAVAVGTGCW